MSDRKADALADSLLILELALAIGRFLKFDLEQRCHEFLRILMARKNLSYGAVWIGSDALRRGSEERSVELVAALPESRSLRRRVPLDHRSMAVLRGGAVEVLRDTDPGFCDQVLEASITAGSYVSYRLSDIGVLRLYSIKRDGFSTREMNQLAHVVETFAISIEGALSQRRLQEEERERKRIEERLYLSQRMDAIGRLTGGIAHDFNNLLMVIQGNAEMLVDLDGEAKRVARPILRAAARGAELTQRLLAFARQQPLHPRTIELDVLVTEMSDLLTRTLGETIDIATRAAPDLWPATADPGQVEAALLNLAINARDAMARGGKLTIECENTHLEDAYAMRHPETKAGDYVVVAVSDEGCGMTPEVRARAFDPFFTTKVVGKGSGLGLSMVYGFAQQSGGHVNIYSEPGRGTTVKLYLPRAEARSPGAAAEKETELLRGREELVMVIEDNPDVRELAVTMLEGLGYRVTEASDAAAAGRVLKSGPPVDLVLCDVVLPGGVSGLDFAETARRSFPDLKIIFMSGYPAEAARRNGFSEVNGVLLNKPFRREQLAKALREALD